MDRETPMHVEDVMSAPLETISAGASVKQAASRMREHDINALFVPGATAGIVTTTDVLDAVVEEVDLTVATVGEVMTSPIERITTTEELTEAAAMMTNFDIKHLPGVDIDGDYVGMISSTDLTLQLT